MDPANLSIGHSEVSLTEFRLKHEFEEVRVMLLLTFSENFTALKLPSQTHIDIPNVTSASEHYPEQTTTIENTEAQASPSHERPSMAETPVQGPSSPVHTPAISPVHSSSPHGSRSSGLSPSLSSGGKSRLRPRISREDVRKRLMRRRSFGSPSPSTSPAPTPVAPKLETSQDECRARSVDVEIQIEPPHMDEDHGSEVRESEARDFVADEKDKDRMSIVTTMTDITTETATIETAEKLNVSA